MDEMYVEMADAIQRAEVDRARQLLEKQKQVRPAGFEGFCDCGEEVPTARVALGFFNCVTCQSNKEKRARR